MSDNPTIIHRDPQDLRLHPLQKHLPQPDKESAAWHAYVDSVDGAGIEHSLPLIITDKGQIMGGAKLWHAAKQLGWIEVPCVIQPDANAAVIILDSLFSEYHMSQGARVYLALHLMPEFVESANARRLANLRRGRNPLEKPLKVPKSSDLTSETVSELCDRFGVTRETWSRAVHVFKLFSTDAELKAEWEPALLSGEASLWNILSAVGGKSTDQSSTPHKKLSTGFTVLCRNLSTWNTLSKDDREQITQHWRAAAADLPPQAREALAEALQPEVSA